MKNTNHIPKGDAASNPIILFDGVCNLCNASVQSIIRWDKGERFRFCSLQSERATVLAASVGYQQQHDSIVLIADNRFYVESTAVLHICRILGGFKRLLFAAIIIPPFLRDAVYRFVARNRYRWFGRRDVCMIPTPELRRRFLS